MLLELDPYGILDPSLHLFSEDELDIIQKIPQCFFDKSKGHSYYMFGSFWSLKRRKKKKKKPTPWTVMYKTWFFANHMYSYP